MKAIVNYLRDLYSLDEKKPSRGDFIAQLALLWVMNLLFLLPAYGSVLPSFLLSRIGDEYVAAYSSYVQLSSLITGLGIPWIFFMALASFFTIRRVYGRQFHPVFQAFGALSIYIFFRYIVLVIYWVLGFAELLGSPSELVPMVNQGHRNLLVALFPLALLGLLLILHSLITLKPSVNVPAKSKELGPAKYSAYYLLYHFICTILSLTMAAVSIHKFNGDFDSPMMIFSAVLLSIV
ncbi:MAG: hypothetical protein PF447_14315, partial [Spirochaetaceae bacterium]|nr:hypothetical protein [Spirochaetaceae bacterium]